MPICITGMHRSGTSLVAQLLSVCGVDLGPEEEFFPANEFNADGYWENTRFSELGDAVLEALGGGWDSPPEPPEDWAAVDGLEPIRAAALQAIEELGLAEPWGWKDPRAALALPFWIELLPDLRVVVCVRHPFEVARSLHRRAASSPQLALSLWQTYNERLLAGAEPDRRVVTHYRAYLADARAELERLSRALALDVPAEALGQAASRVKAELRHHESAAGDPPLPGDVLALYEQLCAEAEVEPEPRRRGARKRPATAPLSHELAADAWRSHLESLRQNRDEWQEAAERAAADLAGLRVAIERLEQDHEEVRARNAELEHAQEELRARASELEDDQARWQEEARRESGDRERWERHAARASALAAGLRARGDTLEARVAELERERDALGERAAALEGEAARLRDAHRVLQGQQTALHATAKEARVEVRRLRDEHESLQAQHAELEAAAAASTAEAALLRANRRELQRRAAELEGERDELEAERDELEAQRDELEAQRDELEGERAELAATGDRMSAELREASDTLDALRREEGVWRGRHEALAGELAARRRDLAEAERERAAYAEDRDRWRDQARLLQEDRDRWQEQAAEQTRQAAAWRSTAEQLAASSRLGARLRRAAAWVGRFVFWLPALLWSWLRAPRLPRRGWWRRLRLTLWRKAFPHLQRAWWALPRRTRDFLRPIIFKDARTRPAVRAYAPPRIRPMPTPRSAGTGVNSQIPRHRRPEGLTVGPGPLPAVSVLIPTLNGGPLFARAIAQIVRQEGLEGLEVVVVDSGSTDGTPDVARRAGATVIEIPQSEFGHGRTRNLAAEAAANDVLLMLVQDALPLTRDVFRNLVQELLEDPRAAAAWARQVPRSEADLYGAFVVYSHERVTAEERARALTKAPERQTPEERRALAGLDDVCAALRRAAWEELRFADVGFAEDLDFGLRAIEAGWTIRHAASAAVAHSHTRDAAYHLRRAVADRLYVAERLGDDRLSRAAGAGPASVAAAAVTLAAELEGAVRRVPVHLEPQATLDSWLHALGRMLERKPPRMEPTGQLALLAEALRAANGEVRLDPPVGDLRQELLALLSWPPLRDFGRAQLTPDPVAVADLVAKLAASALGRALGDALRLSGDGARARDLMAGV